MPRLLIVMVLFFGAVPAWGPVAEAQRLATRFYLPNLADEDWSFLRDPSQRTDFWDPIKYISLGREDRFLTLGGELKLNPQGFRIKETSGSSQIRDNYLLQRYLLSADLHLSRRFRFFGELQSGLINGRLTSPRPTDKDRIDLHQAFFEWKDSDQAGASFRLRVGRQELAIGSSRLISASPGLNVKRSFDGVAVFFRKSSWRFDAAVAKLVELKTGGFDDIPDPEQTFWGFSATRKSPRFDQGQMSLYYLGLDRRNANYAQGVGRDQRHTLGVKWAGVGKRWDLNYDGIFQWGSFEGFPARAWAISTETGFRLSDGPWQPRVGLRFDAASGDKDLADPRMQSFNPLFPGASFAGVVGLLGPTNLTDLNPSLSVRPARSVLLAFETPIYWRTSEQDGLYATDLRLLIPPAAGRGRSVGINPGIIVNWQPNRHFIVQAAATKFDSSTFLQDTFVANGFFFYTAAALYRF